MKHKLTKEDLERYPALVNEGCKEGDEVDIPEIKVKEDATADDDTGGSNPPPDKERPDKP